MSAAKDAEGALLLLQALSEVALDASGSEQHAEAMTEARARIAAVLDRVRDENLVPAPVEEPEPEGSRLRVRLQVTDLHAKKVYASTQYIAANALAQDVRGTADLIAYLGGAMGKAIGEQL